MLPHLTTYKNASHAEAQLNCQIRNAEENSTPHNILVPMSFHICVHIPEENEHSPVNTKQAILWWESER